MIFRTTNLTLVDWVLEVGVAASILILEETRKVVVVVVSFLRKNVIR
jgi:hypothetical protein